MRLPALTDLSVRQKEISDRISNRRGGTRGPFLVWLRSPDYYCSPYELGYGKSISFNHDFIGRDALEKVADNPPRRKVTLVFDVDDVRKVMGDDAGFVLSYARNRVEASGEVEAGGVEAAAKWKPAGSLGHACGPPGSYRRAWHGPETAVYPGLLEAGRGRSPRPRHRRGLTRASEPPGLRGREPGSAKRQISSAASNSWVLSFA
jgi:hypothetical protein